MISSSSETVDFLKIVSIFLTVSIIIIIIIVVVVHAVFVFFFFSIPFFKFFVQFELR